MSKLFLFVLICLSLDGFSQITSKKKMARAGDNAPAILEWVKSSVKPSTLTKEQEEKILAHLEANTQASKKVLDKYNPATQRDSVIFYQKQLVNERYEGVKKYLTQQQSKLYAEALKKKEEEWKRMRENKK